ncbi:MAG TPA: fumarylacetoacetate hydrolase family protein [Acidimicrobiales bacterium]|nr:fumarylacetoacetate hydrolase family protein [Acidimicrobiales bacterium]
MGSQPKLRVLARFLIGIEAVVGIVVENRLHEVEGSWTDLLGAWANGQPEFDMTGRSWDLSEGRPLIPMVPHGRGIFCVGLNYDAHHKEVDESLGKHERSKVVVFSKLAASLAAAGQKLELSSVTSTEFDWEVELGVVIGRSGRSITQERAFDYVSGYTLVNDVTARDVQKAHGQWFLGKNNHGSTPVGPWIIYRDDLGSPPAVRLRLSVNGEVKQDANTDEMIHSIPELIEIISSYVELQVGDIIATGSPAGVGFIRVPPEFLTPGDVLRTEIVDYMFMDNAVS